MIYKVSGIVFKERIDQISNTELVCQEFGPMKRDPRLNV